MTHIHILREFESVIDNDDGNQFELVDRFEEDISNNLISLGVETSPVTFNGLGIGNIIELPSNLTFTVKTSTAN